LSGADWAAPSHAPVRPAPALAIRTPRLELLAASSELIQAALAGPGALASELGAHVPETWPHEFLDSAALRFFLARLAPDDAAAGWWLRFVLRRGITGKRALIGSGGYKGPPGPEGVLELGYGIVEGQRGMGYATEVTQGLVDQGFALEGVSRIVAHTLPDGTASIRVLLKNGFVRSADPAPAGTLRFELTRARFAAQPPRRH
jgi:[ribosomal protein S5]-alanine N-acetyltransferase